MSERPLRLLLVDDDSLIHDAVKLILPDGWVLRSFFDPKLVPYADQFDAAFVDMHLIKGSHDPVGLKVIAQLSAANPQMEIVGISGDLNREIMELTLKAGASRFLAKPLSSDEVRLVLEKIEALVRIRLAKQRSPDRQSTWIGSSQTSDAIRRKVADLRGEPGPILIEGDSGTGKEVISRLLHEQEPARPFVSVNVAAVPENLFESELFGHVKGAFTGADQTRFGLAEAAHGGDLFLDEIEALPLNLQPKLLRFLESGEIRKVGAKESTRVHVRVIVATNQNLEKLTAEGNFRDDLLWRINGRRILLPTLAQRKDDIPELAQYFLNLERPRRNKTLSAEAIQVLQSYDWPGNVRELRRIIEQVALISPLPFIRAEDVDLVLPRVRTSYVAPLPQSASMNLADGLTDLISHHEKWILAEALKQCPDVDSAAELLKISRSNFYKKIKEHDLSKDV